MIPSRPFLKTIELLLILAVAVSAQTITPAANPADQYAAPIEWKLYKISSAETAVKFPKLPVRNNEGDPCRQVTGSIYHAYADQSVYEFRFYTKASEPIPSSCTRIERSVFGQGTLERRLTELRNSNPAPVSEADGDVNGRKATVFRWKTPYEMVTRWVIPDMANNRWRELQIASRPDMKPDEKLFTGSLVFSPNNGIEILGGSPATLGDKGLNAEPPVSATGSEHTDRLLLKSKPRPPYTDVARQHNTQGAVTFRVSFLANGGIGAVTVVGDELPNGLTDNAISAAKKIVFLPQRVNGVPINVVKMVEYSFSIY